MVANLREDLAGGGREVLETHISLVFRGERDVIKVKKPVSLGFVDYSTPRRRRHACEDEVRLNSRLAPGVYLGVEAITRSSDGAYRLGGSGAPVDWAVRMKRLQDRCRADLRLVAGTLEEPWLHSLAGRLARFHGEAPGGPSVSCHGALEAVRATIRENFDDARASIGRYVSEQQAREIERWQLAFLEENGDLFGERVRAGRIREGHGDLRLEHVYLDDDGRATVIDCVEFSARLRCCDVCADVAFLAMDLTWNDRDAWAERFLAAYAAEANDFDLYPLVDFYESYRAFVRGKVSSILADDAGAAPAAREYAAAQARRYYLLALASERRRFEPPRLIAVGGIIGAGKSTLAAALSHDLSVPIVSSDLARKFMMAAQPYDRLSDRDGHVGKWEGAYASDRTAAVYSELARRATAVLRSGRTVVVDASFREAEQRHRFERLAEQQRVPFLFIEAHAPREVCRARLDARGRHVSDARGDLLDEFAARWETTDGLTPDRRLTVDTSAPLEDAVRAVRRRLG